MKSMLKKSLAFILALTMVFGAAPLAGLVGLELPKFSNPFATKAEAATEPEIYENTDLVYGSNGTITRIEWLHNLTVLFEMTVSSDNLPDNYFFDLDDSSEYYKDAMLAVEFGVVDIPAGGNINPEGTATREFAAQTLNYCLGFQLENTDYTFSDVDAVTYDADAQIALNRGWFALSNGKFNPEQNVTTAEINKMIADVQNVLGEAVIDYDKEDTYDFADGVTVFPYGSLININGNTVEISNTSETLNAGDVFAVYPNEVPVIYVAETVTKDGNKLTVTASHYDGEDAIENMDAAGSIEVDMSQFIPAEGVTVIGSNENGEISTQSVVNVKQAIKLNKNFKLGDGVEASVKVTIDNLKLDYSVESQKDHYHFILSGKTKVDFGAKFDAIKMAGLSNSIPLGYVELANGVGKIEVNLKYDLKGNITYTCTGSIKGGFVCDNGNFRLEKSFNKDSFSVTSEIDASVWLDISFTFDLIACKGGISANVGVKAKRIVNIYGDGNKPEECITNSAWLFANIKVTATIGAKMLGVDKLQKTYTDNFTIFDENNSPARVYHHYEDYFEVTTCTRTGKKIYSTPATSKYGSSGLRNARSQGYNAAGETYTIYKYSLDSSENATITKYNGNARSVIIPETLDGYPVTKIGSSAFSGNTSLCTVIIPDNVVAIGYSAFGECSKLSSVTLSKSLEEMGQYPFYNCDALTSIEIPKSLDKCYYNCGPFTGCDNLTNVTFEEGIVEISCALFEDCTGLTSIVIPDTVTRIEAQAFYNCTNLKSVSIPDSVVTIGSHSFANTALESVIIPDSVTLIDSSAFGECSKLSSVTLSKSLEEMGQYPFYNCDALTSIEIPKSLDKCYYNCGPFTGCDNLTNVTFEEGIVEISCALFEDCTGLTSIVIPDTVTRIEAQAFYNCTNLKSVSIPDSVVTIGSHSFANTALESVVIPSKVQSVDYYAFQNCTSLKSAEFKNPDTILETFMFDGCSKLETVKLPEKLTTIEEYTFRNCTILKSVNLPSTLTSIDYYAFYNCDALTEAVIPNNVSSIGQYAFYDCDALTKVVIPDRVTSLGSYAFYGCEVLSEIDFGIGLKTIPDSAFRLLPALTEVYLPRFLTTIAANAFSENTKLREVTIPATVTSIQESSFSYPTKLTFYGLPDSYAQTYATNRRITFVDVSDIKVDNLSFDRENFVIITNGTGGKITIDMTIEPKSSVEPISFSSSDASIATVENGVITVKGYGTATITATTESGKTASCNVAINRMVTSVSLNKSTLSIKEGETATLTATVYPTNATNKNITWASSNEAVATVSNGTVTAVKPGVAIITVKTEDGAYIANCEVTVTSSVVTLESISVKSKPSKTTYAIGESLNTSGLILTAKYSDGSSRLISTGFTCSGFDSSSEGTKTVTVSYGGKTATFTVTVSSSATPGEPSQDTFTVTWIVDGKATTQTYKAGDRIVAPANPAKSGYTFKGWTPSVPSTMPAYDLTFTAVFEKNASPDVPVADVIKQPTQTTISYGDAIILHVDGTVPAGARIEWTASNGNFDMSVSADGTTCKVSPKSSGKTVFTATVYDQNGNIISTDTQEMTAKAGFFDKIVAFFKKIFGLTKVIPQAFKLTY
ncbi:MAG: leucine-rich repeat protein [Acutalibacteraceae bacterium]